jgi:DNA-binding response OmpR family regulator
VAGVIIRIHRRKPVVVVGSEPVKLTRHEHALMVTLGMMDNRLVTHDVLLDVISEGRAQIPADRNVLHGKIYKLRDKVGAECLQTRQGLGYVLTGAVQFIG